MTKALQPVIVGAGPAGVRAAQTLVAHGVRPVVIDEAPRWGGQIYRQPPPGFTRSKRTLYGFEAGRAEALHSAMANILDRVNYRPDTLVWSAEGGRLDLLSHGRMGTLPYGQLIVATGATDRVLPFPGWTLPGVYTLGAAQVALKYQGCAIGSRVVIAGTGPLLYLVAYQYAKAGATVVAVLDTASFKDKALAAPAMLRQPAVFAKGVYYLGWLRAHGVPVHQGVRLVRATGEARVTAMRWRDGATEREVACDAVAFGYALRSETQLADLLGCRFSYNALQRAALPERDGAGRSSVPGVYLAGDGAGIMGADAAEWAGERAALALLADAGKAVDAVDAARAAELEAKLARTAAFRVGLEQAFPFPLDWAASAPDELVICRCEEITAGQLRQCVQDTGAREMNRLKALTRVGMGRCQGRTCGVAAAEILAHACAAAPDAVGRLRGQAPIKPLPFAAMARANGEAA
ncbi:MAG: FAD/NAD(P)-binding oxidoreductase [Polaromonas sp.]|uniref:FAD/NAD(P)-dependent oxidoreductase n=1 Tax=Polaromonas sp. TaxID=1869339 RepID=UPI00273538DF|nr:FAD/NAD(P)-binding oxidoreductase [Polaromonas sp.]MDP3799050.1 FAD/NAD(P)-binding oxidoreductase [Polaromonas sp.]